MTTRGNGHVAIYGNTRIRRSWCSNCEGYAFVLRNKMVCCGGEPFEAHGFKVVVPPRRTRPPLWRQLEIIDEQRNRCLYCKNQFGTVAVREGREIVLSVRWDHFAPFSVFGDNEDGNFVAACQLCNTFKRDLIFQTIEEAARHIARAWELKGVSVRDVSGTVREDETVETVLLDEMPNDPSRQD